MGMKKLVKKILNHMAAYFPKNVTTVTVNDINYGEILKGTHVLVTGGDSGIGFAIAKKFSKEGAKVCITGRNTEKLKRTAEHMCVGGGAMPVSSVRYTANTCDSR